MQHQDLINSLSYVIDLLNLIKGKDSSILIIHLSPLTPVYHANINVK